MAAELLAIDGGTPAVTNHFEQSFNCYRNALASTISNYITSGAPLSLGDGGGVVQELEERLKIVCGRDFVLTCSSGTTALFSAFFALNLPTGTEVIAPVSTFHASITPALHAGLTPVIVDVQADTANLDPKAFFSAIGPKTGAVVVNHTYGHPADMAEICKIATKHNLYVIEDCSHAYGAKLNGRPVGSFGDISVFSMQANKMLSAGEGGFLATSSKEFFDRAVLLGHYRRDCIDRIADLRLKALKETGFGLKLRLHPLACVMALVGLDRLSDAIAYRKEGAEILSSVIDRVDFMESPTIRANVEMGCYFGYRPRLIENRRCLDEMPLTQDLLISVLRSEGVDIRVPSIRMLGQEPIFTGELIPAAALAHIRPRLEGPFTGAEKFYDGRLSISLPDGESASLVAKQIGEALMKLHLNCS